MNREALSQKVLVLGIEGMDPRKTRKYVDEGLMPNTKKIIERGCQRHDLVLLGGVPTITPPMWATLATGASPMVHGITDFFLQVPGKLDEYTYAMHSSSCHAEQIWNVTAESGKKTLVWHWPSASWPPSSDSPNLHVVDGSSPGGVNMSTAQIDTEMILFASKNADGITFVPNAGSDAGVPCVVTDLKPVGENKSKKKAVNATNGTVLNNYILDPQDGQLVSRYRGYDMALSTIKPAAGWADAPAESLEFVLLLAKGLIRRVGLILKNEQGIYDRVAIYKNKKESAPLYILENEKFTTGILDETYKDEKIVTANRNMRLMDLEEDGSKFKLYVSPTMDITMNAFWSPKSLYQTIVANVGYPTPTSMIYGKDIDIKAKTMLASWQASAKWQADSLNYLMKNEGYEMVFSHFHNVDLQGHTYLTFIPDGTEQFGVEKYLDFSKLIYKQTDDYIGEFVHFLDEGWTIIIVSDHALVSPKHVGRMMGDSTGVNVRVMQELGLCDLKHDENGHELREMDWSKTKAVACRGNHIYINLKGKYPHGIVDPADQYEVEEEVMTKLYGYKDKVTGKRIISLALRNQDAVILGLAGPEAGDIIYFMAEGYNFEHGDSLSTVLGEGDTSVSPIFIAAGTGIKQGEETVRYIRETDVAPTVAVLAGVRFPKDCEGAPAYQIFDQEI